MAWIKFEKDLLTDPRVLRIARTLQVRWKLLEEVGGNDLVGACNDVALPAVTLVCGALVRIWSLADTHLGEDDILPLGFDELDDVVGIPGFCEMLPEDWIVEINENAVKLPDFHAHNGTEAKKKAVTQKRVARFRERNQKPLQNGNATALPDQTRPDHINTPTKKVGKKTPLPENWIPSESTVARLSEQFKFVNGDCERYLAAFRDACKAKGYKYVDFDAAFSNCVRQDWPKFRNGAETMPKHADPHRPNW